MTIAERIHKLVTLENANAWNASLESYLFCDDLLASADINPNAARIAKLERMFEFLLEHERMHRMMGA